MLPYIKRLAFCILFVPLHFVSNNIYAKKKVNATDSSSYYTSQVILFSQISKQKPVEAERQIKKAYAYFKVNQDTAKLITSLINLGEVYRVSGQYSLSFDALWEGQYLAKRSKQKGSQAIIHRKLAYVFDALQMNASGIEHIQKALKISKQLRDENDKQINQWNASFLNLASRYRKLGQVDRALAFLDSCIIDDKFKQVHYSFIGYNLEKGYCLVKKGRLSEARKYLNVAKQKAQVHKKDILPLVNYYYGDLLLAKADLDSAAHYYKIALKNIDNVGLSGQILQKLSRVYHLKRRHQQSYNYLTRSNQITDSLNKVRNEAIGELFEIKNTYLESLSEKDELLDKQNVIIKQNASVQLWLKLGLIIVALIALGSILFLRMRIRLRKAVLDKKETEMQSKLAEERSLAEIEVKSKELTSYALQLIDKDTTIEELLEIIKKEMPSTYNSVQSKFQKGAKDLWEHFNMRFTEVNTDFYDRLQQKHPDLSNTEKKHCALIKLNFATKEMARILNIEPHSVHISRSRIRKKIGLQRSESLEAYIASL